jgi:hypothetical protein
MIMIMILDLVLVPRIGSKTHILVQVLHLKDKKCYMCVWDLNRVIHSFPYPTLSGQAQLIKVRYDPHGTSTYAPLGSTLRAGGESRGLPDVINVDTCVVRLVPIRRKREEKESRRREIRKRGEKEERGGRREEKNREVKRREERRGKERRRKKEKRREGGRKRRGEKEKRRRKERRVEKQQKKVIEEERRRREDR